MKNHSPVFFGVEEMASVGSSFYVHDHKEELDTIHLFINIDGQGKAGGRTFDTQGYDDLGNYILDTSKELAAARPSRQAIVKLETRDGRILRHHTRAVNGNSDNPMDRVDVTAKVVDLLEPILGQIRTRIYWIPCGVWKSSIMS